MLHNIEIFERLHLLIEASKQPHIFHILPSPLCLLILYVMSNLPLI